MTCLCGEHLEPEPIYSDTSDDPRVIGIVTDQLCETCESLMFERQLMEDLR